LCTRSCVSWLAEPPLITRETVLTATPACLATVRMVGVDWSGGDLGKGRSKGRDAEYRHRRGQFAEDFYGDAGITASSLETVPGRDRIVCLATRQTLQDSLDGAQFPRLSSVRAVGSAQSRTNSWNRFRSEEHTSELQ